MDLTRGTPTALLTAISGAAFYPVVLVDIDWPGGRIRAHSNLGNIVWESQTYLGVGKFGAVNIPDEVMAGVPDEFTMALSVDNSELSSYADTAIRGRPGTVYLGAVTERGGNVLIGAVDVASGTCDGMVLRSEVTGDDGQTAVIYTLTVTFSTGPSYRTLAAIAHSNEDQMRAYPVDTAGRHLMTARAQAEKTEWPEP